MTALSLFCRMLAAHALADYPLQGDFLAMGKNHKRPLPGVPWWQCLTAHALIHGSAVTLVTGSPALGCAEFLAHWGIDYGKSEGWWDFNVDQYLHVLCKLAWMVWSL